MKVNWNLTHDVHWSPFTDQTTVSRWTCYPTTLPPDGMSDLWEHQLRGISPLRKQEESRESAATLQGSELHVAQPKGILMRLSSSTWARLTTAYFLPTPCPHPDLLILRFFMFNSGVLDVNSNFSQKCIGWRKWEKSHRIDDLVMQSTEKAQCLINGKLVGIFECICSALICDSRGKWLLMKGMCFGIQQEGGGKEHSGLWREGSDVRPRLTCSHSSIQ